mgnify:CR=1 FL=1
MLGNCAASLSVAAMALLDIAPMKMAPRFVCAMRKNAPWDARPGSLLSNCTTPTRTAFAALLPTTREPETCSPGVNVSWLHRSHMRPLQRTICSGDIKRGNRLATDVVGFARSRHVDQTFSTQRRVLEQWRENGCTLGR